MELNISWVSNMGFKKHNWLSYGRKGNIIEISIKESDGANIDFFRVNNQEGYGEIIKMIREKYGYSPEISPEESVNEVKKEMKLLSADKDFKWGE